MSYSTCLHHSSKRATAKMFDELVLLLQHGICACRNVVGVADAICKQLLFLLLLLLMGLLLYRRCCTVDCVLC